MATQLFLRSDVGSEGGAGLGTDNPNMAGSNGGWHGASLQTTRGSTSQLLTRTSIAGPTAGIEVSDLLSGVQFEWISKAVDQDFTVSGTDTITFNIRGAEASMNANATIGVSLQRINVKNGALSNICNTNDGTELGTSEAAANWTATGGQITSTTFNKGDRIRARVYWIDATALTMASGHTLSVWVNGPTAAASGDSYITFSNTFGFLADPSAQTLYFTNTSTGLAGVATNPLEMWTARGAGVTQITKATANGWHVPAQFDHSGGGTVEWYTKPIQAVTLAGLVQVDFRLSRSGGTTSGAQAELAVCDGDGTNVTVLSEGNIGGNGQFTGGASEVVYRFRLGVDDVNITDGQRLRVRINEDDSNSNADTSGNTITGYFAGTSGGASGDSFIVLPVVLTEFVGGPATSLLPPPFRYTSSLYNR